MGNHQSPKKDRKNEKKNFLIIFQNFVTYLELTSIKDVVKLVKVGIQTAD